jgi:hypothetical protein
MDGIRAGLGTPGPCCREPADGDREHILSVDHSFELPPQIRCRKHAAGSDPASKQPHQLDPALLVLQLKPAWFKIRPDQVTRARESAGL